MNFIYRAKLMARYEKILLGKVDNVWYVFVVYSFCKIIVVYLTEI